MSDVREGQEAAGSLEAGIASALRGAVDGLTVPDIAALVRRAQLRAAENASRDTADAVTRHLGERVARVERDARALGEALAHGEDFRFLSGEVLPALALIVRELEMFRQRPPVGALGRYDAAVADAHLRPLLLRAERALERTVQHYTALLGPDATPATERVG